jgi:uncharacterized membrane protein
MTTATRGARGLAAIFAASGVVHLIHPQTFEAIVPHVLPHKRELVYASGVVELACAGGLMTERTRRLAGLVSAGLLIAVLPANVQMAVDLARHPKRRHAAVVAFLRLPLQYPLVRVAWREWRRP